METITRVVLLAGLCAVPANAGDLVLTRPATSGVASLIGWERGWTRTCEQMRTIVTITRRPAHGEAFVDEASSVIPASTPRGGPTGQCAGQSIVGKRVMYRSAPGFHGEDSIAWDVTTEGGHGGGHVEATIRVR